MSGFLGGVVLAGGTGKRMGQPKGGIELGGTTLAERAAATLRHAGCDPVVIADQGDDGPLVALAGALAELRTAQVVVLACDLPLAGPVVTRLLALPAGAVIAAEAESGREQPFCSLWPTAVARNAAAALVASGERRMMALVDALDPQLELASADELLNVNTPEDLTRAVEILHRTLH